MNRFNGERLDIKHTTSKNNLLEHLARYEQVKGNVNSCVLDIGCGTGYGSNILAGKFKKIYAVDVSGKAIQYAKEHIKSKNIEFINASGASLPFDDNTFDISVAFEVIEHIKEWRKFLRELQRVLKPQGKLYFSTPNKAIYNPWSKKPINPYHFFEMKITEFQTALQEYFTLDTFLGQRTPVYNDHWIWNIVDPFLYFCKGVIPYKVNNSIKLHIINRIKPNLEKSDIIFSDDPEWIKKSRIIFAVCTNKK